MIIVCPIHGEFLQAPGDHLKGYGCSKCSGKKKHTTEEWINLVAPVYNYKYDYSKVQYIDNKTPVTVICPEHGEFHPYPHNHAKGESGCPVCKRRTTAERLSKTTEQFIQDAVGVHGNTYDYSKVNYVNKNTPIVIICKKHGEFEQLPSVHLAGYGCKKCRNKIQALLYDKILATFPNLSFIYEKSVDWLNGMRFDIYCKDYNFAIEYDGQQHFYAIKYFGGDETLIKVQQRDLQKNLLCVQNNCTLFRLKYSYSEQDFDNLVSNITELIEKKTNYVPKQLEGGNLKIVSNKIKNSYLL